MKIVLFGKNGMLGSEFMKLLGDHELLAYDKEDVDLLDLGKTRSVILDAAPDFVINCAGYTAVDDAEANSDLALRLNCDAVATMADACLGCSAKLIHFSTDYVFDGKDEGGYAEDAQSHPVNAYGQSKLLGEEAILESLCDFYIVRTSWLFGKNGPNFVEKMIELSRGRKSLNVVDDQFSCPTYSLDLAKAVVDNFLSGDKESGIYHLTNSGSCSRYEFTKKILDVELLPVASSTFNTPAARPQFSVLLNTKLPHLRSWQDALADYLSN
ncbi:dTDP-4-dehydrorhamnose reductase [Patescibacteria group bacterium]|nr:dTDP-4-dehydrorhamnose reductase [Patescibacteria group bacterium]